MGVPNRKLGRDELVVLLDATGVFTGGVEAQETLSIAGKDLFATVHSGPGELLPEDGGVDDSGNFRWRYTITWWTQRDESSSASEDSLDLMAKTAMDVIMDNRTNNNWDDIELLGASQPTYVIVDGIHFRMEAQMCETLHFVDT